MKAYGVILAGGPGERYWPLTHKDFPKYRIKLDGKISLLQKTYKRLLGLYDRNNIYVVTTKEHMKIIRQELPLLDTSRLLIEPMRKNTAAAILFSTASIAKKYGENSLVSFYPADHLIQNETLFRKTLREAMRLAAGREYLVTIGIKPAFPATGYGYIQSGKGVKRFSAAYRVARFTEKPVYRVAQRYIKKKNYYWNGGIFTWRASVFLKSMKQFSPKIYALFDIENLKKSYDRLPKLSIDYALLEKTGNMAVVATRMDWCDMGSWDMFLEKGTRDKNRNLIHGKAIHRESSDSLFINYTPMPLVALGVNGFIVVQTERGTLICKRNRSEEAALLARY